jgi:Tol biopolymer transport system component
MGEVYAAEDLRLHRLVALKVLPSPLAVDPERRQRFEREAQAVAALNHPNIVTIHSVEQDGDVPFLTMELVDGKPLSDVIPRQGLTLDRLLDISIPLTDAIAAAHQRGITHRDLKPANVMVTGEGRIKVLDFGLAKLKEDRQVPADLTEMPTVPITGEGRIVGTVAYMSPEQAEGKGIDHRSDIFSLGILLYEMATGERPFKGDTSVSILSSILKDTPRSVTDVNRALPRDIGRIVRRCLAKDAEHRYQSAKDLRNDLEEVRQSLQSGELNAVAAPVARGLARGTWIAVAAVLVVFAGATIAVRRMSTSPTTSVPARVDATFTQLTTAKGIEWFPSLSPDGKWIIYAADAAGNHDIYLQSVGGQTPINLTKDSAAEDSEPTFSPDGERIAFYSERDGGGIFVMGRTGESVRRLTDGGFNPAWSPNGEEIVFASQNTVDSPESRGSQSTMWRVTVASGQKHQVAAGADAMQPQWSPHGQRIAFWTAHGPNRQRDIATVPASGGEPSLVTTDPAMDWNPIWSPDGRYLYFSSDRGGSQNIWRIAIDERSGKPLGSPEPITTPARFAGHLTFSADGKRLAYSAIEFAQNLQRVDFDPSTERISSEPAWVTSGSKLWGPIADLSPDGQWLTITSGRPQEDVFVVRPDGGGLRQLTNDAALDRTPRWSPDGKRIAFQSNRNGSWDAWIINGDGSGLAPLTVNARTHGPIWSPDGSKMIGYEPFTPASFIFDPRRPWADQKPDMLSHLPSDGVFVASAWSPDGRLIAGSDVRAPGLYIYAPIARSYAKILDAGEPSGWLRDSRRLFAQLPDGRVIIVDTASKKSHQVFAAPRGEFARIAAVSRDDRQVILFRASEESDIWMATLKQ